MSQFYTNCVNWPPDDVHVDGGLRSLVDDCSSITRRTFLGHVDHKEIAAIEDSLGYEHHASRGLCMASDWHVEYFRSRWHGQRVYGFCWSAIEFVFVLPHNQQEGPNR